MNWLKRKLASWARQGNMLEEDEGSVTDNDYRQRNRHRVHAISTGGQKTPGAEGITFMLYPASGGNILEIRHYDNKSDSHNVSLHIIKAEEDLGEAIGKIITFEALKR